MVARASSPGRSAFVEAIYRPEASATIIVWWEGPPGHTGPQQWEGPPGHLRCDASLDRGVKTAGEGSCSTAGSEGPRGRWHDGPWWHPLAHGGVGRIGGTAMAALCVPSGWLRAAVWLRAAYRRICVGSGTASCNVDVAAGTCGIWRRRGAQDDVGGAHGRSARYVDGRSSSKSWSRAASQTCAIARGTGARVLGAYDNVARMRRKSSGPNNTHSTHTTQHTQHTHNTTHTHTHTHTHISGKVSGDGSMTQPSKFGLTLEIRFDTVVSRHVLQLYHKRQIVPRHLGCRTSLCTSFGTGVRRARRAFGVRLSSGVRLRCRVRGGG